MSPRTLNYLELNLPKNDCFWKSAFPKTRTVLEVGSTDLTGNARKWFQDRGYHYTGLDIAPGPNVDVVVPKSCIWRLPNEYDWVISLNTFEHVDKPWVLLPTMAEHLKQGGLMLIVAPFSFPHHRHPHDTFRYAPDGMAALAEVAGLTVLESYLDHEATATWGTVSDMLWLTRRGRFREAMGKIGEWWTRPPAVHCVALMARKG